MCLISTLKRRKKFFNDNLNRLFTTFIRTISDLFLNTEIKSSRLLESRDAERDRTSLSFRTG